MYNLAQYSAFLHNIGRTMLFIVALIVAKKERLDTARDLFKSQVNISFPCGSLFYDVPVIRFVTCWVQVKN